MSLPTIRQVLAADVIDSDPSVVSANNSTVWPTSADVADYGYKSLGTIWVAAATTSSTLASRIVYKSGEGTNNALGEISLIALPMESVENQQSMDNNRTGALDFYLEIVYRLPDKQPNWDKIQNASLRVRYLLDFNWRRPRKLPPQVVASPTVDKSLDGGLFCRWLGYKTPPNGIEVVELWLISQQLVVPK